ncbi:MAG: hypothetical protein WBD51_12780, partial [Burkholderiaceae bacterium]
AHANAIAYFEVIDRDFLYHQSEDAIANRVRQHLKPEWIESEQAPAIVTNIGFVTMAILPTRATCIEDLIVVPGVDDQGHRGLLVISDGHLPFHSLALDADHAIAETKAAHQRAEKLVEHYGGRHSLRIAARTAPWHLVIKPTDIEDAGLCAWGVSSFLRRTRLRPIAMSVGLPRVVLRFAGAYGDRLTASALVRQANPSIPTRIRQATSELPPTPDASSASHQSNNCG